jgi:hypothetical protein
MTFEGVPRVAKWVAPPACMDAPPKDFRKRERKRDIKKISQVPFLQMSTKEGTQQGKDDREKKDNGKKKCKDRKNRVERIE